MKLHMQVFERDGKPLNFHEGCEMWHIDFLKQFKEEIWPIYEKYNISFSDAIQIFLLNNLDIRISQLVRVEDDDKEEFLG